MPDRAELISSLLSAVRDVQLASGRSLDGLDASSRLFGGIAGFDSLNALEALAIVGATHPFDFPENLLAPMTDGSSPTVGDLADRILAGMEKENVNA